jgi:hypothetical protein
VSAIDLTLRGRAFAESLFIDRARVERPGEVTTDPESGVVIPTLLPVETVVACKIQSVQAQATVSNVGEDQFTVEELVWQAPFESGPYQVGDVITYLECPLDPVMVGSVYRISELARKSYKTAQRFNVEVITD